jgi:PhzF family phenazine biosynthesis protein
MWTCNISQCYILWGNNLVEDGEIFFDTLSGILIAKKKGEWIELDLPKGKLKKSEGDEFLLNSFSISPKNIYESDIVYLLEFNKEEEISLLNPNFNLLRKARKEEIIVTSKSDNVNYDFVSRFFAPAIGIDEDPVTGSAHCYLTPYWIERLNKDEVLGFQASERTGYIKCKMYDDRVIIQGKAVIIMSGTLNV